MSRHFHVLLAVHCCYTLAEACYYWGCLFGYRFSFQAGTCRHI